MPSKSLTTKPLYAQMYERWHRRRAKNPKITLRQTCDEFGLGVSYAAISSAKYRAKKRKKGK